MEGKREGERDEGKEGWMGDGWREVGMKLNDGGREGGREGGCGTWTNSKRRADCCSKAWMSGWRMSGGLDGWVGD